MVNYQRYDSSDPTSIETRHPGLSPPSSKVRLNARWHAFNMATGDASLSAGAGVGCDAQWMSEEACALCKAILPESADRLEEEGPDACPHLYCSSCCEAVTATYARLEIPPHQHVCPLCRPLQDGAHSRAHLLRRAEAGARVRTGTLQKASEEQTALVTSLLRERQTKFGGSLVRPKQIRRVYNPALHAIQMQFIERMRRTGKPTDVVVVFHGTNRQAIGSIVMNGFDASRKPANGRALGHGIYSTQSPHYALNYATNDSAGGQCLFICKAAPGGENEHVGSKGHVIVLKREQQIVPLFVLYL